MKIYLAGQNNRERIIDEIISGRSRDLAVGNSRERERVKARSTPKLPFNILMSFATPEDIIIRNIPRFRDFILDSGAFTYLAGRSGDNVDWNQYVRSYASFINKNKIEKFIELDIDPIVGYEKVLKLRSELERLTGKRPIPVWHKSRGRDDFIESCKNYPYVAIGGIVTKEIKQTEYKFFPWFIDTAHKYGAKIHGLGLTNMKAIERYKFDSVDSSSWTCGNRFGYVYKFNGKRLDKVEAGPDRRLANAAHVARQNFTEWVKYANYIEGKEL